MVVIAGKLTVGEIPGNRPAALKNIGTILATPKPNSTKPTNPPQTQGVTIASSKPIAPTKLPPTTTVLLFKRTTSLSPTNRMRAIAMEKDA